MRSVDPEVEKFPEDAKLRSNPGMIGSRRPRRAGARGYVSDRQGRRIRSNRDFLTNSPLARPNSSRASGTLSQVFIVQVSARQCEAVPV